MTLTHYNTDYVHGIIKAREDIIAVRDGELAALRQATAELQRNIVALNKRNMELVAAVEKWENQDAHESMECYAETQRLKALCAQQEALIDLMQKRPPQIIFPTMPVYGPIVPWKYEITCSSIPAAPLSDMRNPAGLNTPCSAPAPAPSPTPADNGTPDRCSSAGVSGNGYEDAREGAVRGETWRRPSWGKDIRVSAERGRFWFHEVFGHLTPSDRSARDYVRVDDRKAPTL